MKNQIQFNKILPHLYIALFFLVLALVYTSPIFEGKKLIQGDVLQSKGVAEEINKYKAESGKRALWTNSLFGGMPTFMVNMGYPMSLTTQLGRFVVNIVPYPANMIFLYMLGAYLLFIMLGYNQLTSLIGSVGYAFASYNIISIEAGHVSKVIALAAAPPLIGSIVLAYRGKYLLGSALAGLFAGLELYANHIQITYYIFITLVLFVIYELIRQIIAKENLKNFAIATLFLIIAGVLAVGSHASRIWTNYAYTNQTIRGPSELKSNQQSTSGGADRNYAFEWSYGIGESFTFLIPNFVGGGTGAGELLDNSSQTFAIFQQNGLPVEQVKAMPMYWGSQPFTSGPAYMGAIFIFLAVFGLIISQDSIKWWLLGTTIVLIMLAWGKNLAGFNYLIFDIVPLYNKFRAHTMTLSLAQIFVVWLAVLGLKELFSQNLDKKRALFALKISGGTVGGLVLFFALLGGTFQNFRTESTEKGKGSSDETFVQQVGKSLNNQGLANQIIGAIRSDRASLQRNDAWRSFIFIALSVGLLWLCFAYEVKTEYVLGGIAFLILIDLWMIDRRYLNNNNFVNKSRYEAYFEASDADRKIQQDKDLHFRVYNVNQNVFSDGMTSFHHKSISGYSAARLRRYQEFMEKQLGNESRSALNMLNTKYYLGAGENGEMIAQPNLEALGNAWFVPQYNLVKNADEEMKAMDKINPKQLAVIDQRFESQVKDFKIKVDSTAQIKLTTYAPDVLTYESNAQTPQMAIFSEIYYVDKGKIEWKAYIDGKEVPHFRANYILRGLIIPAGKHQIEFKFAVPIYQIGESIALICSIILLIFIAFTVYLELKKSNIKEAKA